jgi:ribulose-phosphate 3-epimerase
MSKKIQVSASILCADFTKLGDEIRRCEDAGVDSFHVDVMDGHFVPNISIGQVVLEAIRPLTRLPIEAHLMVEHPSAQIDSFIDAGADIISIHAECYGEFRLQCRGFGLFPKEVDSIDASKAGEDILRIKQKGKKVFMVVNPGTPLCMEVLLKDLDGVLVMSVNPGFAKQKFMPEVLSKVSALRKIFNGDISVDGGINEVTAPRAVAAGAGVLATASYLFSSRSPKEAVRYLKSL